MSEQDRRSNKRDVGKRSSEELQQEAAMPQPEAMVHPINDQDDQPHPDGMSDDLPTFSFANLPKLEGMVRPGDTSANVTQHADAAQTTTPSPQAPAPFPLSLHDATIKCVCPPGTTRLAKDTVFVGTSKEDPHWVHLPCKPYTVNVSAETADQVKAIVNAAAGTLDISAHVTQVLGHAPNEKQRLFLKHFTSTFHCDGPCEDPKPRSQFLLCKKCCAWQHKPCMLYGDPQDRGGPVCNRCYLSFLLHRDEIIEWQRKRLLLAVKEGWIYLSNPENYHQEWRRAWIRRWLARFFEHNQVVFHKYNVARKKAERLAAAQAYYSRVRVMPQVAKTPATQAQSAVTQGDGGQTQRQKSVRKQPERKKSSSKASVAEADDDQMEDAEGVDAGDSDEIVVASTAKNKAKSAQSKAKPPPGPVRSTTKKAGGKRQASSFLSPSPLAKKKKPEMKSRAPRKSAPSFVNLVGSDDDGDDEDEGDEEQAPDKTILQQPDRRRTGASDKPAISCRCPGKAPTRKDCFKCRDCGIYQHYACATDVQDGLSVVCNFCHVRSPGQSPDPPPSRPPLPAPASVKQLPKPKPSSSKPTPAPPQQAVQPAQQYDPALQEEVNHLCATVLWREYCSIPIPDEDEPTTNPASGCASPAWLTECQARLMSLLTAAGQEKTSTYLRPALAAWPRQNHLITRALRDLALEEIMHGSFMRKRKELGLLLEVLGLDEKGSVWKGSKG